MTMRSKSIWIFLSILGLSQLTGGTEKWNNDQPMPFAFPSQFPSASASTSHRQQASDREGFDYTNGFPQGFAQGLPSFDFGGPVAAADEQREHVAESDTSGFVSGPPDGFPTLEQLGGNFPNFGENVERPSASQLKPYQPNDAPVPNESEEYDDYGPGPGGPEASERYTSEDGPPRGPPPPYRRPPPPPPPGSRPPPIHFTGQASGRQPYSKHPRGRPSNYSPLGHPKKPVYIKTSTKNKKLPAGPPVFYAPSPDVQSQQSSSHQGSPSEHTSFHRPSPAGEYHRPSFHPRYRRSSPEAEPKTIGTSSSVAGDQKPAATEGETFWELTSSPFIVFDTYKNDEKDGTGDATTNSSSFPDHDGGEQRFFPSFPAPAPYLVGPFGGGPPSRPPLFPGPAANRAPSRYHPQYQGGPKFSPPPPNRGPSNVYTSESHDHYQDNNLLGSGNFEVVRGGTYYGDDDDGYHGGGGGGGPFHEHDDGDYFHHNGHSSPQEGYRLPGQDFFANFRDFADINPPSRAFSHRHEAIAAEPQETITFASRNRNSNNNSNNNNNSKNKSRQPKNILEKLENPADGGSSMSSSSSSRDSDPMMATF